MSIAGACLQTSNRIANCYMRVQLMDLLFVTPDQGCNGLTALGSPIGYISTRQICDTIRLFMCYSSSSLDYSISIAASCEVSHYTTLALLGYAPQFYPVA